MRLDLVARVAEHLLPATGVHHRVGFEEIILSGYPHLEEAYWFGEGVLPILRDRGLVETPGSGATAAPVSTFR